MFCKSRFSRVKVARDAHEKAQVASELTDDPDSGTLAREGDTADRRHGRRVVRFKRCFNLVQL